MSDEPDITQRPGWKAVERWLKENESPQPTTPMRVPIAKWGTRGLIAGGAVGFVFLLACCIIGGDVSLKGLLAFPMLMGIVAIPCALAGMLIWLNGRD